MATDLRGYTPFELFNKVLNTDNNSLQVDIVDATGVTVTVDSEFPAAGALSDDAANPTTTSVGSFLMGYDSGNSNWNRVEVDDDGNLQVDVVSTSADNSIVTLGDDTYTEASSKGTAIGGVRNDILASLADTDNEWAPLQFNSSGALYIDVANGGVLESAVDGLEGLLTTIDADTGSIKTAIEIVDDWDESDRAAVNIIPSQVGVAAGAGAVNALTQRVILASDDPAVIDLAAIEVLLTGMDSDTDAIKTATQIIDNAVHVDDDGFTLGTHSGMMMMGFAGTQSVDADDAGAIAMDTDGAIHIADGGNVISVDDGGSTISIDDGGSTISIDDGSGSLTVDGAVTATISAEGTDGSTGPAKTLSVGGTESGGNIQELRVDSDGHLQIDVLSGGGGTEYSEDAVTPGTIAGLATMMERDDALGGLTPAEGDWASLRCDANGALWTHDDALDAAISGSEMQVDIVADGAGLATSANQSTIIGHVDGVETLLGTIDSDTDAIKTAVEAVNQAAEGTISATTQRVTIATDDDGVAHLATIAGAVSTEMQVDVVGSLPAGSAAIGKLAANSGVDIGDVDVTSLPASTNTLEVVGDAAENAAAAGNPVLTGGRYDSPGNDNATVRALGDNDVGALALDPTGALYVREYLGQTGSCFVSGTSAVTAAIGKFVAIQFLEDTVFNSTDGLVATDTGRWPDDSGAASDISSSNTAAVGSQVFPQGMTIFGRWDSFILVSGAVIAYVGNV